MTDVLIVGAGIFGLAAAIELRGQGLSVVVIDPGPIPHPRAASTDLNKAVRMEYGRDTQYMRMVDRAIDGWLAWNELLGQRVYEQCGVLMLAGGAMSPGEFEHDSYQTALAEGHTPERIDGQALRNRFPAWNAQRYPDGFFHTRGGYARSGIAIAALARHAKMIGIDLLPGQRAVSLIENTKRVAGINTASGQALHAGHVVLAPGVWVTELLPELNPFIRPTAHPLFYLAPPPGPVFTPPRFPVFCADVAQTGWYGFPIDTKTGLLKIALHDAGHRVAADDPRDAPVHPQRLRQLAAFLTESLPGLADTPIARTGHCYYTDTQDGHLLIDRHPEKPGLTVATGGSGHAMKFAPVLGPLIADATLAVPNDWLVRFRWRTTALNTPGDAARAIQR